MTKLSIQQILAEAEKARASWAEKYYSEEVISAEVHRRLDQLLNVAIYTFLGLEHSFGTFRVDHCNGRKTILSRQVEGLVAEHLPDLAKKYADQISSSALNPKWTEALQKEYNEILFRGLRDCVHRKAAEDAQHLVESLLREENLLMQSIKDSQLGGEELAEEGTRKD